MTNIYLAKLNYQCSCIPVLFCTSSIFMIIKHIVPLSLPEGVNGAFYFHHSPIDGTGVAFSI